MQSGLPNNPYTPDQPIRDPARFFGRADTLAWLAARLDQYALAVVHGPPRIGITSLFLQACAQFSETYQATYLDLTDLSVPAALAQVARVVSLGAGLPATESTAALRQAFADSIHNTGHQPILIALDGLAGWDLESKNELLSALGLLCAGDRRIRFVLSWGLLEDDSISKDMPLRLVGLTESLPPIAQTRLGAMTRAQLSQLMTETAGSLLKYDFQALERVWQESNGRPHVAQMVGFAVYDRRGHGGRVGARTVELALADAAARLNAEMSAAWEALTREEQLTLAAAATVRGEHGLLATKAIVRELHHNNFGVSDESVQAGMTRLVQLDVMEPAGVAGFRFSSGLMRVWAVSYANLAIVTGRSRRLTFFPGLDWSTRIGVLVVRLASWALLAAFFVFLLMGGVQLVQGIAPAPTATPTSSAPPTPTRTPLPLPSPTAVPRDVFAYMGRATDKDRWRIYTAGIGGAAPRALTSGISDDQWPVWSPDGTKIAFASNRDGNWEVYVMNGDGSEQTRLTRTRTNNWSPAWAPDGKRIVFASLRDRNWEIYGMGTDGSSPTRLTDEPSEDHAPVWSPDGRVIAFASKRTGNYEIYLMNPDGSQVTRLTETAANNVSPAWAPDGKRIAFESNRDGNWEIYAMGGDGSDARNLSSSPSADQAPAWSPDGAMIAFHSNRSGAPAIWVMRADGGDPQNWTPGGGMAQFPSWRPTIKRAP
ncbi:MAG: PD40 domain-containing protein [Chloroflexi bacterium]|nr:PD40 domain-containing protein [Chloroflexota bacterium]